MKKEYYSKISIIISMLISLGTISSCDSQKQPTSTESNVDTTITTTSELESTDQLPSKDMNGFELCILNFNKDWMYWCSNEFDADELNSNIINDAIFNRNRSIESKYNCVINEVLQQKVGADAMSKAVSSGDTTYDMYMSYDTEVMSCLEYSMDWKKIPYISFNESWWIPDAMEALNVGGAQLALTGCFTLAPYSRASCLVFNKDIYSEYSFEKTPYEMVNDNEWTLDAVISLGKSVASDLNGDNIMDENDRYGYFSNYKDYATTIPAGCGVEWCERDSDGYLVFNINSNEKALDLLILLADTWEQKEFVFGNGILVHDVKPDRFFENGHAMMCLSTPFNIEVLRQMDADIGIVPLPKYDSNQQQYYAPSSGVGVAMLPKTVPDSDMENIGIILESIARETYDNILPQYIETAITIKSTRDAESAEMLEIIFNSIKFDPGLTLMLDPIANEFLSDIYNSGSEVISSSAAAVDSVINGNLEKIKTAVNEYFGK